MSARVSLAAKFVPPLAAWAASCAALAPGPSRAASVRPLAPSGPPCGPKSCAAANWMNPWTAKDVFVPGARKEPGNEPPPVAGAVGVMQSLCAGDTVVLVQTADA